MWPNCVSQHSSLPLDSIAQTIGKSVGVAVPRANCLQEQARGHIYLTLELTVKEEGMRDRREEKGILTQASGKGKPQESLCG